MAGANAWFAVVDWQRRIAEFREFRYNGTEKQILKDASVMRGKSRTRGERAEDLRCLWPGFLKGVKIPLSFEDGSPDCRRGGETKALLLFRVARKWRKGLFQVVTFLNCEKRVSLWMPRFRVVRK
jgi:hypothetical protein